MPNKRHLLVPNMLKKQSKTVFFLKVSFMDVILIRLRNIPDDQIRLVLGQREFEIVLFDVFVENIGQQLLDEEMVGQLESLLRIYFQL